MKQKSKPILFPNTAGVGEITFNYVPRFGHYVYRNDQTGCFAKVDQNEVRIECKNLKNFPLVSKIAYLIKKEIYGAGNK